MNKILIERLEKLTASRDLSTKSWEEIVGTVVLPQLAGTYGTRWCINDQFMNFLAENMDLLYKEDHRIASALAEIALQRLSCGAVSHHGTVYWLAALPQKYWDYTSKWDEAHIMTEGCFNFLLHGISFCMSDAETRRHAKDILFGIIIGISLDGDVAHYQYSNLTPLQRATLRQTAEKIVEENCCYDEVYAEYAFPTLWKEHEQWFAKHYEQIDWPKFFADTQCDGRNIFLRKIRQRRIKKNLLKKSQQPAE